MLQTRNSLTKVVKDSDIFCALAAGVTQWGSSPPNPTNTLTDVIGELGRKKVLYKEFCTPDDDGDIIAASGQKFVLSQTPTNYLYVRVAFEPDEVPNVTFREIGWFWKGTTTTGLPDGQLVFAPSNVVTKGDLLALTRRAPVVRNNETRLIFHNVINF